MLRRYTFILPGLKGPVQARGLADLIPTRRLNYMVRPMLNATLCIPAVTVERYPCYIPFYVLKSIKVWDIVLLRNGLQYIFTAFPLCYCGWVAPFLRNNYCVTSRKRRETAV